MRPGSPTLRRIGSVLLVVGSSLIAAGIVYFCWLMWRSPTYVFVDALVPALILGGVLVMAIGAVFRSCVDSRGN